MKKIYSNPEIEYVSLSNEDVLTSSFTKNDNQVDADNINSQGFGGLFG